MSAARPPARIATAVERVLRVTVWASQACTAAIYLFIAGTPDEWRSLYKTDRTGAICGGATLVAIIILWLTYLWAEQRHFYDRSERRAHRKIALLAHALALVFALGSAADQHEWAVLWAVPTTVTVPAVAVWHAWMKSLALPPEDQAVIDAILKREAQQSAARFDVSRKEQNRDRLNTIVTQLGYQLADFEPEIKAEPAAGTQQPATDAPSWRIPPRKHQPLVYLLRNGNRIKIGTTTELKRRIRTLALRPENVVLLLDGDQRLERELHRKFAGLRIGDTEWFAYDGPLIDFVHAENARAIRKEETKR